ncbi:MAG TPA: 4-alpha-glucanotransferase, partial [Steroidobacteraceae bacterium]|nr:4-alpha-glucanotransferase [Steroidobacteraceae bacterium]
DVPPDAVDARGGRWRPGPGEALFLSLAHRLGSLPLVAEDLGETGEDVAEVRDELGLAGMCVPQFAFDGDHHNPFLPRNHVANRVAYTGTHDNDTTLGWYSHLDADSAARVDLYLGATASGMPEALIRAALGSVARLAIVPVQDLLALSSEARLNTPGTTSGNWTWTLSPGSLSASLARRYAGLNAVYGRA